MTIINTNSISGINSITAQGASGVEFFDSSGNSVQTVISDGLTVGTGATIGGSTNTITASTNGSEALRLTSGGSLNIGGDYTQTAYKTQITGDLLIQKNQAAYQHPQVELYALNTGAYGGAIKFSGNFAGTKYAQATIRTFGGSNTSDGSLAFFTGDGTEKLRITSAGKLLLPTNSPGIQFGTPDNPAASGGIDIESQTLDDYEEGTWTPTSETGTIDYTSNKYTKIGNIVHINAYINNWSNITSDAVVQIQSLPFAGENTDANVGSVMYRYIDDTDGVGGDMVAFMSNGNSIRFYFQNSDGDTNYSALKHKDIFSATLSSFRIQMTYRAA